VITLRPAATRGNPRQDWISSFRTFSFPGWFDPRYRNYSDLQTINDDFVQPNGHVPWHEHKNMEIFGYVVKGTCRHTDSFGQVLDIPSGAVQRMSCGTGISHTEGNATDTANRYLQLWIRPDVLDTEPRHDWHQFTREDKLNKLCNITEYLPINQDARLLAGIFNQAYSFPIDSSRRYYLYVISGTPQVNNLALIEGDGLSFEAETEILINSDSDSEIIVFDLR
jgi:redox-sensitive bicupin YhaK (pirin superfamily)